MIRKRGGQPGNLNGLKKKVWTEALRRALLSTDPATKRKRLELAVDALVRQAIDGDVAALREVADRIEGKASQPVENADGQAFKIEVTQRIVDAGSDANA